MKLQGVEEKDNDLAVDISGTISRFHYFSLRDNCPDCRSPNGQKLHVLMQPGALLLLDNERVLHGRAGQSVGARHLQGCYADRDGLLNTLKILEKNDA